MEFPLGLSTRIVSRFASFNRFFSFTFSKNWLGIEFNEKKLCT